MATRPLLVLAALLLPGAASAAPLGGTVHDGLSGAPLPGVHVVLEATEAWTATDAEGRFALDAPEGAEHVLRIDSTGHHALRLTHQRAGTYAQVSLLPLEVVDPASLHALPEPRFGVPWHRQESLEISGAEQPLPQPDPRWLTLPAQMPATIKVARYFADGCSGSIQRIDTLAFEDYVAGVVPAEIGVFKSVPGGPEISRAAFETFAILARSYALWFYLYKGGESAQYHINDTACNQRYKDARDSWITGVIAATAGQVLAKGSSPSVIDKFEYAASCGRYGTLPEYQTELVPDKPPVRGCTTGGWCGHDTCAAHQDNPAVPGTDRCLVRGTCQWGSLEWSMSGKSSAWTLDHYEPNLVTLALGEDPKGNLVGVIREGSLETGPNVVGATVTLEGVGEATTDGSGLFRFDGLDYGTYVLRARAPGYDETTRTREVAAPGDTWASMVLNRAAAVDAGVPAADAGAPEADAGSADAGEGWDAGAAPDSGSRPDAGVSAGGGGSVSGGCGCGLGAGGEAAALLLLGLALGLRARRIRAGRR